MLHLGEPAHQVVPPTWRELGHAVRVSGPEVADLEIHDDEAVLRAWTLANLRGYWAGTAAQARNALSQRAEEQEAGPVGVAWLVLGAARLHATLRTGQIISKSDAGAYVAQSWPKHAELARRCVRWRAGADERFTTPDGLAAADLVDAVVEDAALVRG